MGMDIVLFFIMAIVVIIMLVVFFRFFPVGLWITAAASGVHASIFSMIGMRFRRINPSKVVLPMIKATKAGLKVNMNELEAHLLAGGSVDRVVDALIAPRRARRSRWSLSRAAPSTSPGATCSRP